jgi:hypothetical protein
MSNRLGGKQGTAYLGTNAQQPPNWNFYPHDPTIYTYQNFSLGDLWLNTVTQQAFVLVSLERNTVTNEFNAIWTDFTGTAAGVVESLQAADGTVAFPVNGQIDFPSTVIIGNTNAVTNILTSAQPNNGGNFLINLTPQISLRNDTNGVDSITLEQISVSGGAWNSTLKFLRADGTIAAPTAVSNNFGLGSVRWFGYTGSGYTAYPSAGIKSLVKGVVVDNPNPALSEVPACLAFAVSKTQLTPPFDLNSLDIKLQIDPNGQCIVQNSKVVAADGQTGGGGAWGYYGLRVNSPIKKEVATASNAIETYSYTGTPSVNTYRFNSTNPQSADNIYTDTASYQPIAINETSSWFSSHGYDRAGANGHYVPMGLIASRVPATATVAADNVEGETVFYTSLSNGVTSSLQQSMVINKAGVWAVDTPTANPYHVVVDANGYLGSYFPSAFMASTLNVDCLDWSGTGAGALENRIPFTAASGVGNFNLGNNFVNGTPNAAKANCVPGYYQAPQNGVYSFQTCVTLANILAPPANSDVKVQFQIYNSTGATQLYDRVAVANEGFAVSGVAFWRFSAACTLQLNAGERVYVECFVDGAGPQTVELDATAGALVNRTWFSGHRVS